MGAIWPYLVAIIPSAVVAVLFYFLMKGMLEGDRRERLAQSKFEAEQDRARTDARKTAPAANNNDGPPSDDAPVRSPGNGPTG